MQVQAAGTVMRYCILRLFAGVSGELGFDSVLSRSLSTEVWCLGLFNQSQDQRRKSCTRFKRTCYSSVRALLIQSLGTHNGPRGVLKELTRVQARDRASPVPPRRFALTSSATLMQ